MDMKKCNKCGELKHHYKNQNQCADCKRVYNRQWSKKPNAIITMKRGKDKWANKLQGVYGIFTDELCVYVGESRQLLNRISQHKTYSKNPESAKLNERPLYRFLNNVNYNIEILEECSNHVEREQHYIDVLKPLYNVKKK